jgi:hypothetical protein
VWNALSSTRCQNKSGFAAKFLHREPFEHDVNLAFGKRLPSSWEKAIPPLRERMGGLDYPYNHCM